MSISTDGWIRKDSSRLVNAQRERRFRNSGNGGDPRLSRARIGARVRPASMPVRRTSPFPPQEARREILAAAGNSLGNRGRVTPVGAAPCNRSAEGLHRLYRYLAGRLGRFAFFTAGVHVSDSLSKIDEPGRWPRDFVGQVPRAHP